MPAKRESDAERYEMSAAVGLPPSLKGPAPAEQRQVWVHRETFQGRRGTCTDKMGPPGRGVAYSMEGGWRVRNGRHSLQQRAPLL